MWFPVEAGLERVNKVEAEEGVKGRGGLNGGADVFLLAQVEVSEWKSVERPLAGVVIGIQVPVRCTSGAFYWLLLHKFVLAGDPDESSEQHVSW